MAITASISLTENSYSTANNTSSVTCKVTVHWTYSSNDRNNTTKTLTFNGTKYTTTTNINSSVTSSGSMVLFNKTLDVAHNSDGTKTVSASVRIPTSTSSGTVTASKSLTLTNIPRYPSVSQSLPWVTETVCRVDWSSDSVCDYVWYSLNWGTTWVAVGSVNSTYGSFNIGGLSAGSSYHALVRLRGKDSQLTNDSAMFYITTYDFPHFDNGDSFTIGGAMTLRFYNPLARLMDITIYGADGSVITTDRTSYQSRDYDSSTFKDALYRSIPSNQAGKYSVNVTWEGHSTTTEGAWYSVNASECSPLITGQSYKDTNSTSVAITEDDQKILVNRSLVEFKGTGISSRLYANVSSVALRLNGTSYAMSYSSGTATASQTVTSSGQTPQIIVTDSRGLAAAIDVPIDIVDYSAPNISATARRDSGFYSETDITPTVNYTSIGSNAVTLNLKARKVGTTTYTIDQTIPDSGTTQLILDNEYAWEILLTATDTLGGVGTYNITLARGLPLMYFDTEMNSVALNQFPSHSEAFEIAGDLYINASKVADFVVEQGTSGIWTYEKMNSGIVKIWGEYEDISITNGFISIPFPTGLFVSVPKVQTTPWYGTNASTRGIKLYFVTDGTGDSVNYGVYLRTASGSIPTGTYAACVYGIGRWK